MNSIRYTGELATPPQTKFQFGNTTKIQSGTESWLTKLNVGLPQEQEQEERQNQKKLPYSELFSTMEYCPVYTVLDNDKGGKDYIARITGIIGDISQYVCLLEYLATMKENDNITIYIDSPGGQINTGVTICTHIAYCQGVVTTYACGTCASAGSLIWSAGHVCLVAPTASLMWHMSSHMDLGNSIAIRNTAACQVEFVKKVLLNASCKKGHITQEEVDRICTDPDYTIWISAKEMQQRLTA